MVIMPEYLKATSKPQSSSKPRIISEVKKNCLSKLKLDFTTSLQDFGKSKFSGQLLRAKGNSEWALRLAEVRQGNLILVDKASLTVDLRLPLRGLNLRPCNTAKTFCLAEAKGLTPVMFQALTEDEYKKWVRILAVELIRQTPLQNVRFLDILSIIRHEEPYESRLRRNRSEENLASEEISSETLTSERRPSAKRVQINARNPFTVPERFRRMKIRIQNSMPAILEAENRKSEIKWMRTQSMSNLSTNPRETSSDESGISSGDETHANDNLYYVPVRERKKFFESLNAKREADPEPEEAVLSRSSSIGNLKNAASDDFKLRKRKRTRSLHDLHNVPVREICQLFETRDHAKEGEKRSPDSGRPARTNRRRNQRGEETDGAEGAKEVRKRCS